MTGSQYKLCDERTIHGNSDVPESEIEEYVLPPSLYTECHRDATGLFEIGGRQDVMARMYLCEQCLEDYEDSENLRVEEIDPTSLTEKTDETEEGVMGS